MGHERLNVDHVYNKKRLYRWHSGGLNQFSERFVQLGQLPDQRWWATLTRDHPAYVFDTEAEARELVDEWLAVGEWEPWPAVFDGWGQPIDGRKWLKHGQGWRLADDEPAVSD